MVPGLAVSQQQRPASTCDSPHPLREVTVQSAYSQKPEHVALEQLKNLSNIVNASVGLTRHSLKKDLPDPAIKEVDAALALLVSTAERLNSTFGSACAMTLDAPKEAVVPSVPFANDCTVSPYLLSPTTSSMAHSQTGIRSSCTAVKLLPPWNEDLNSSKGQREQTEISCRDCEDMTVLTLPGLVPRYGDDIEHGFMVMRPDSKKRLLVDVITCLAIMYDLTTLPLTALNFQAWRYATATQILTSVVWTAELPLQFLSGYHIAGYVETRKRQIAKRYIFKGWFFPDLLMVLLDWFVITLEFLNKSGGAARVYRVVRLTRVARIARLVRIVRLVRVFKLKAMLTELNAFAFTDNLQCVLTVAKLTGMIYYFCHLVGCAWYALCFQTSSKPGVDNWVTKMRRDKVSMFHRYLVAIHWVFAQFTPSPPPSVAKSNFPHVYEEMFNMALLMIGFGLFSTFTGSVTANVLALQKASYARLEQNHIIRRYVQQYNVSLRVGNDVMSYVQGNARPHPIVRQRDVLVLAQLPVSLKAKLYLEVYGPAISVHPLFSHMAKAHTNAVKDICLVAAAQKLALAGEIVCERGEVAAALFVRRPTLEKHAQWVLKLQPAPVTAMAPSLIHPGSSLSFLDEDGMQVKEGEWFCEVALWLSNRANQPGQTLHGPAWLYEVAVIATKRCEMVELNAILFSATIKNHPTCLQKLRGYAKRFQELVGHTTISRELWSSLSEQQRIVNEAFDLKSPRSSKAIFRRHGFWYQR